MTSQKERQCRRLTLGAQRNSASKFFFDAEHLLICFISLHKYDCSYLDAEDAEFKCTKKAQKYMLRSDKARLL